MLLQNNKRFLQKNLFNIIIYIFYKALSWAGKLSSIYPAFCPMTAGTAVEKYFFHVLKDI